MKAKFDAQDKAILLRFAFIIIGLCAILLLYRAAQEIEYSNCEERMAKELGISSTSSIYNALHTKIKSVISPGMRSVEVAEGLQTLYPIRKLDEWVSLDEKKAEYIALRTCYFTSNDWKFLFVYSKEGQLEEFRNYIDD